MAIIKIIIHFILSILYPPLCLCGKKKGNHSMSLCSSCMNSIILNSTPFCKHCGNPLPMIYKTTTYALCNTCRKKKQSTQIYFSRGFSATIYASTVRTLLIKWKYSYNKKAGIVIKNLLLRFLSTHQDIIKEVDFIIPVPLHFFKRIKREFNQAEELAKTVSIAYNIPVVINNLKRIKYTQPMKELTQAKRKKNITNAFTIHNVATIRNKHCLLIDDIYTTGTTLNECAKMLQEAGAKDITILTFAIRN